MQFHAALFTLLFNIKALFVLNYITLFFFIFYGVMDIW